MIDELELSKNNAKAIVGLGINAGVYDNEMPKSAKDILEAAHEIVAFAIDSYVKDGYRADSEDEDEAEVGKQIEEIFEIAGMEVDDEGGIDFVDAPQVEATFDKNEGEGEWVLSDIDDDGDDDDADEDDDDPDSDDGAFDIDSVIEGYADLAEGTKLKEIKKLKLDPDEDEDYNTLIAIEEFENEQEKPSTKVLNYIESVMPEEDGEGEDGDEDDADATSDDDDETADEAGDADGDAEDAPYTEDELKALDKDDLKAVAAEYDVDIPKRVTDAGIKRMIDGILAAQEESEDPEDGDEEGGEYEEPYQGYDTAKLAEIKAVINEDDRPLEDIEYLLEYEEQREKPRAAVVKALNARIAEFSEDGEENEVEVEEKPKGRGRAKAKVKDDPSEEVDGAVDRDDAADDRKARRKGKSDVEVDEAQVPKGLSGAYVNSKLTEKTLRQAGLTPPTDFEGDMPELPADIDAVDHSDLSNLLLGFQNAHSTAVYQSSMAYIESDIYEEISNYLRDRALLDTDESNDAKRRADAQTDPLYLAWRGEYKKAYHRYVAFRDLARTIEGKIKVLSRVGGFKDDEQQAGDLGARSKPKAKPAVKAEPAEEAEEAPAKAPAKRSPRKAPAKPAAAKPATRRTRRK